MSYPLGNGLLDMKSRVATLLLLTSYHLPCFVEITEGLKGRVIQHLITPRQKSIVAWQTADLVH